MEVPDGGLNIDQLKAAYSGGRLGHIQGGAEMIGGAAGAQANPQAAAALDDYMKSGLPAAIQPNTCVSLTPDLVGQLERDLGGRLPDFVAQVLLPEGSPVAAFPGFGGSEALVTALERQGASPEMLASVRAELGLNVA
jgi:hypothetical protein